MRVGGRVFQTTGISALPEQLQSSVIERVRTFDKFTEDNDPYGEHDFGSFKVNGHTIFWKIDYYDKKMEHGSENPSDPGVTTRVLTIMLSHEY